MRTYNIGFYEEISKITSKLSSNTCTLYLFLCTYSEIIPNSSKQRLGQAHFTIWWNLNLSSAHRVCPVSLVEGDVSKGTLNQNEQNSESLG